jgi:hypothetical protein
LKAHCAWLERLVAAGRQAAGHHGGGQIGAVAREFAEDVFHLAGIDQLGLDFGIHVGGEAGAMRAGEGKPFADHIGRIGLAIEALDHPGIHGVGEGGSGQQGAGGG